MIPMMISFCLKKLHTALKEIRRNPLYRYVGKRGSCSAILKKGSGLNGKESRYSWNTRWTSTGQSFITAGFFSGINDQKMTEYSFHHRIFSASRRWQISCGRPVSQQLDIYGRFQGLPLRSECPARLILVAHIRVV